MPLVTAEQQSSLRSWGFLEELVDHFKELIEVARAVHSALNKLGPVSQSDLAEFLPAALMTSAVFGGMIERRGRTVKVDVHFAFADAMARYLIEFYWNEIVRV